MKTLVLIDANALIHRSFHALPPLTAPSGQVVNAAYGFTMVLLKMIKDLKPDCVAAAFDLPEPTFRHEAYKEYKATRKKAPDELYAQIPVVKEILGAFGIPVFEKAGFEADDIIGTIASGTERNHPGMRTIIVTGDMDTLQLVDKDTAVYSMRKGVSDTVLYDEKGVKERYEGLTPKQMNDYKGLKGDPSDNIPGVPGVGEKTALEIIKHFGSIEKLYQALEKGDKLSFARGGEKLAKNLLAHKEQAFFSKKLVTLCLDVPVDFRIDNCRVGHFDLEKIRSVFRELGFGSLLARLGELPALETGEVKESAAARTKIKIEEIKDQKAFDEIFAVLKKQKEIGIALDFTGDIWRVAKISGISIRADGRLYYFPRQYADGLKPVLEDASIKKSGYNLKLISEVLAGAGIEIKGLAFDILIAAYLLNPGERSYEFAKLVFRESGEEMPVFSDGRLLSAALINYGETVRMSLEKKLVQSRVDKVFFGIEMPLIPVLARMEAAGIRIDRPRLLKMADTFEKKISGLQKKIYELAGSVFNIDSPRQVGDILFDKLKIDAKRIRKTPGGKISTRASELLKLRHVHPLVDLILDYRELAKLKNTYIDVLPGLVDKKTGRLYTTFNQAGTSTGRLASDSPNIQNIPAPSRGEWGREIRRAFTAEENYSLVSFDYSQIELRIAAHLAGDKKMQKIFKEGGDIHRMTAAEINNILPEKVTVEMREAAKTLNFGVLYGMSAQGFSQAAGIPLEAAKKFIAEYFEDFRGVRQYVEKTKRQAYDEGYVETLMGRRRYLPEIHSPNFQVRSEAERMAINMPVQGLAADIIKMAMVRIGEEFSRDFDADKMRPLLQVHDELVFEMKYDIIEHTSRRLKEIMETVLKLDVPVIVEVKSGPNWGEMTPLVIQKASRPAS